MSSISRSILILLILTKVSVSQSMTCGEYLLTKNSIIDNNQVSNKTLLIDAFGEVGQDNYEDALAYVGLSVFDINSLIETGSVLTNKTQNNFFPPISADFISEHPAIETHSIKFSESRSEAQKTAQLVAQKRTLYIFWMMKTIKEYPNSRNFLPVFQELYYEMAFGEASIGAVVEKPRYQEAFFEASETLSSFNKLPNYLSHRAKKFYALLNGSTVDEIKNLDGEEIMSLSEIRKFIDNFFKYEGPVGLVVGINDKTRDLYSDDGIIKDFEEGGYFYLDTVQAIDIVDIEPADEQSLEFLNRILSH